VRSVRKEFEEFKISGGFFTVQIPSLAGEIFVFIFFCIDPVTGIGAI
jgi:hypothetical protein